MSCFHLSLIPTITRTHFLPSQLTFLSGFNLTHLQSIPHNTNLTVLPHLNLLRAFFYGLAPANLSSLIFTSCFVSSDPVKSDHLQYQFLSLCSWTYYFFWLNSAVQIISHSAVETTQLLSLGRLPSSQIKLITSFVISLHFTLIFL